MMRHGNSQTIYREFIRNFVLMKKTVLESGNEALKQMGADGLKKKQFVVCRTNSKVHG